MSDMMMWCNYRHHGAKKIELIIFHAITILIYFCPNCQSSNAHVEKIWNIPCEVVIKERVSRIFAQANNHTPKI